MILLYLLAAQIAVFLVWCVFDAKAAFDGDPNTHSASEFIRRWVRHSGWHRIALTFLIADGAAYLLLHLILQLV